MGKILNKNESMNEAEQKIIVLEKFELLQRIKKYGDEEFEY